MYSNTLHILKFQIIIAVARDPAAGLNFSALEIRKSSIRTYIDVTPPIRTLLTVIIVTDTTSRLKYSTDYLAIIIQSRIKKADVGRGKKDKSKVIANFSLQVMN